jgi:hypothetical protein
MAGCRGDAEGPAERGQPVRHALDAGAHRRGRPVESPAVIPDGEGEGRAVLADGDAGLLGLRVLRDVLQRFQHAEVHRGLDLLGVPAQPGCFNGDRQGRLLRLRLECCREPRVRQQRRVDPPGEIPEFLQRVLRLTLYLREHLICFCWGIPRHLASQPERDLERDKLLLRTIVQVPLQAPAGLVGGGDEALARGADVFYQRDVAQHQACLRSYVPDQPLPRRRQRLARRTGDP